MNMKCFAKRIGSLIATVLVLATVASVAYAGDQAAPQWNIGDCWQVGAWHGQAFRPDTRDQRGAIYKLKGRMVAATFEVINFKTVDEVLCYEVKLTFPREDTNFQRIYMLYYAKDSGRLVQVHDVSILPSGTTKDLTIDVPATAGPEFLDDIPSPLPLDWPDMSNQNVTSQTTGTATTSQVTTPSTVSGGSAQSEDEVTLNKSTHNRQAKVVQRWRKGEPWWRSAKKYRDGTLVGEAILLEVNGHHIADMPAASQ